MYNLRKSMIMPISVGVPKLSIEAHTLFLFYILFFDVTCDVLTPLSEPGVDSAAIAPF